MSCNREERVLSHAWQEVAADGRSIAILIIGFAVFAYGLYATARNYSEGSSVVFGGASIMMLGVLLPAVSEAELGLGTFKFRSFLRARDDDYKPFVSTERDSLTMFANLLTQDNQRATEVVADAFAITYVDLRRVPPDDLRVHMLCTIVHLACGRQRVTPVPATRGQRRAHGIATSLGRLPIEERALALLADHQDLDSAVVAAIMQLPVATVDLRLRSVRQQLQADPVVA